MKRWRKIALALFALELLFLVGRWAYRALASDETKIRWRIEEMVDGFNDCKTGRVLDGLAPDFRDRASGATRQDVHAALVQVFFEQTDSRTHEFTLRAELVADDLAIAVERTDPPRAEVAAHVLFHERTPNGEQLVWDARVLGQWEQGEDGWQWTATTDVNHRDRRRWR